MFRRPFLFNLVLPHLPHLLNRLLPIMYAQFAVNTFNMRSCDVCGDEELAGNFSAVERWVFRKCNKVHSHLF